jgi:hypothetical protein
MAIPKVLFVVPGLLAGLLVPAFTLPHSAPAGSVGMVAMDFAQDTVYLHQGEELHLYNSSDLVHVIGPGVNGTVITPQQGNPVHGFHLMQTDGSYTTPPWKTLGVFHLTCSVHPMMNLTVVVTR